MSDTRGEECWECGNRIPQCTCNEETHMLSVPAHCAWRNLSLADRERILSDIAAAVRATPHDGECNRWMENRVREACARTVESLAHK